MGSDFSTALSLLTIGMITVFVVLLLVVITGNILIRLVNRFAVNDLEISVAKVAAIAGAVEAFTQGKGQITRIEKK